MKSERSQKGWDENKHPLLFAPEGDSNLARHRNNGMPEAEAHAHFERALHP